jgi:NDP-sugar pyrophosphorylase family protein
VPDVAPDPGPASASAGTAPLDGSGICAVVLAAGAGRRLRPLTSDTPKALCPVGNVPLLDRALAEVASLGFVGPDAVAVNAWYHADQIVRAVGSRAYVSLETGDAPLGTAGGLGALNPWIAGRHVLVANSDAYLDGGDLSRLLDDWTGDHVRILGVLAADRRPEFGPYRFSGFSLVPAARVAELPAEPGDLVRVVWRPAEAAGELRVIDYGGTYIDSGTAEDYLAANLHEARRSPGGNLVDGTAIVSGSATHSVIGAGAVVSGTIDRTVVWPGAVVAAGERLTEVIRYGDGGTVQARLSAPAAGARTVTGG